MRKSTVGGFIHVLYRILGNVQIWWASVVSDVLLFRNCNGFLSPSDLSQGSREVVWVYGIDYLLHMTSESVLISWECLLGFCADVLCLCPFNQFFLNLSFYFNLLKFHICDPGPEKPVSSCWGIFVAIAKNTLYGSKL